MLVFVFLSLNGSFHVLNLPEMNQKKKQIDFNSFGLFFCTFDTKVESIKMNRRWSGTWLVLGIQHFVRTLFVLSFLFISMASNSFFLSLHFLSVFHISPEPWNSRTARCYAHLCILSFYLLNMRTVSNGGVTVACNLLFFISDIYRGCLCPCLCTYALYSTQIGFI